MLPQKWHSSHSEMEHLDFADGGWVGGPRASVDRFSDGFTLKPLQSLQPSPCSLPWALRWLGVEGHCLWVKPAQCILA